MAEHKKETTPVHPDGPDAVGPAYHPNDADYVIRWHEHRGDVQREENGPWYDAKGIVVDHRDFPPPPKIDEPSE